MANYDAQINILVSGQRNINNLVNQLNQVENAISEIESRWRVASTALQRADIRLNVSGRQQPRGEGGRFAADPDRRVRQAAYADRRRAATEQRLARLELGRTAAEAARARSLIDSNETIIRQAEQRITLEQRLNSAVRLLETRQQKFARGGGGSGAGLASRFRDEARALQEEARSITAAFEAAGGASSRNLRLVNSLATGLGRVVERQNELNRLSALGGKGFEAGRRLQERITEASSRAELPRQRVVRARSLATEAIAASRSGDQQAYAEAIRRATAATARLERESRELVNAINDQEREVRRITKLAPRSPVQGGVNFPGSPRAIEAQLRQSQKGFPASPISGTLTMAGSPKWLAAQERSRAAADRVIKAQERSAKIAENAANRAADKALLEAKKGYPSSPILGAATMAGSPRAIQAQERNRAAVERRMATQRRAEERAAKFRQQAAAAAERAADRALKEAQKGFPSSPVLGGAGIEGSPRWKTAQESAKRKLDAAARAAERAADKAIAEAQKGYPSSPILGAATMPGSPKALQAQERSRATAERALRAQERATKAAESAADKALSEAQKGYPSSPIMGAVTMAGSPRWKAAQEAAKKKLETAAKAAESAADRALAEAQRGYPSSPILGGVNTPGSPKALEAQRKQQEQALRQAQQGYPASPILGTATMAGSPRAMQAQERARATADRALRAQERAAKVAETAADRALKEAQKGYPSSPVLGTASMEGSPRWKAAQQAAERKLEAAAKATGAAADKALAEAQKGFPSSPILGGINMPGSPIFKQTPFLERRFGKRGSAAIGEGLIGGAFPLLFGQGLGASIGGGVGGAAGGFLGGGLGFGLSLVGTAVGSLFDQLNQAAQETGKALNYPIEGFEKLKEAGLFASRAQEYYISKLIETGQTARATAEIQAEMIKKIGVSGVNDLMRLGDASTRLSKAWAEFNLQLQAALAGPMAGLLEWIANVVSIVNQSSRAEQLVKDVSAGLSGSQKEAFDFAIQKIDISEQVGRKFGALFGGLSKEEAARQRTALAEFYKPGVNMPRVREGALTPEQQQANLDKAIEKADKARSLVQQGIALERSNVDLRLNIEDTVYGLRKRATDMEREAVEFRRSVEDQIFSKRQELERRLAENERKRQQNAIDAFDLQLQKASVGLDPIAQGVVDAAREYLRVRAEGEADLQLAEKQLKLELQGIDQEVSRYKLQVEDRISQMAIQRDEFSRDVSRARLQIERQIGDYVIKVEEHRLEMAKHRYEVETNLEKKKQIAAQEGLTVQAKGGYTGTSVDGFPITSRPGMRRGRMHAGVDIAAPTGTALGYEMGGKVLSAGWIDGYGKTLKVALDNGMIVLSGHLNEIFVKAGQRFEANQRLAAVGSTGRSTGPHTHQESWMNGKADPYASLPLLQLGKAVSGKPGRPAGAPAAVSAAQAVASGAVGAKPIAPPPPSMPALPSAPQLVGINDLMQQYLGIIEKIRDATAATTAIDRQRLAVQSEAARLALEQQVLAPILQYKEQNRELEFEIQKRKERNRLAFEGVAPELIEGEMRVLEIQRDLNSILAGLETTTNQAVRAELERLKLNPKLVDSTFRLTEATLANLIATTEDVAKQEELRKKLQDILNLRNQLAEKAEGEASGAVSGARGAAEASVLSPREKVEERIGNLRKELNELVDPANQVIAAADAIGSAFSESFKGVISGSMSAQEALANFFQRTADHFLDMAAQMIAKMITLSILNQVVKILPGGAAAGGGGFSFGGPSGGFNLPGFQMPDYMQTGNAFGFAQGGMFADPVTPFAKGGMLEDPITPFAMGGAFSNSIVKSPTLFKFADGGTMNTGLMGEAGPEAIMPLTRGPGGRLGVDASGSGGGDVNVTVNVDAKGSSVEGNQQQGAALGRVISVAVQAEIVKQKRPGGLLA